jgi:signal transduction histidine kinase
MDNEAKQGEADNVAVCLEAFPEPAVRYTTQDDTIILTAANERFVDLFNETEAETPFSNWWAANNVSAQDYTANEICTILTTGGAVDTTVTTGYLGGATYQLKSTHAPGPTADGTIAFSTVPDTIGTNLAGEQIASVVSHDLRNPLDVAKARTRAAKETGEPEHFERLEVAHERMERIIKDVLTLARNDEIIDPSEQIELEAVATDAWATVETGSARLTLKDDLPTLKADSDRLQRLFENLFRNSIEHSTPNTGRDSGGSSKTKTHDSAQTTTDKSGDTAAVTVEVGSIPDGFFVADDGPGIPSEIREQVFKPGHSVADNGTGLGLTIVKRIADAHDWDVATTHSGEGARFEFRNITSHSEDPDGPKS